MLQCYRAGTSACCRHTYIHIYTSACCRHTPTHPPTSIHTHQHQRWRGRLQLGSKAAAHRRGVFAASQRCHLAALSA